MSSKAKLEDVARLAEQLNSRELRYQNIQMQSEELEALKAWPLFSEMIKTFALDDQRIAPPSSHLKLTR